MSGSTDAADSMAAVVDRLRKDPAMASIVDRFGAPEQLTPLEPGRYFERLARSIIFQQISGHAASAILRRLEAALPGDSLAPGPMLSLGIDGLRAQGVSPQKARYLIDLSERTVSDELPLDHLHELAEGDVIAHLTQAKGIGRWTAHMFLMFTLGRPDVLPVDDHGIRTAMLRAYEIEALPKPVEMEAIAEAWRPFRTYACDLLWKSVDTKR